jgi:hypothetical protein
MKRVLLFILLLPFSSLFSQEDFTLRIDGKTVPIGLDKVYEVMINGKKVSLTLQANDTLTYSDEMLSFRYPKGFNVTRTKLEVGIEQLMIITATGSGIIIQKYTTLNPSSLKEIMLSEVTKESVSYGYTMKREDYNKTLRSGAKVDVYKAVLNYKEESNIYEVAAMGKKDEGVLLISIVMGTDLLDKQGQELIDLVWKTLNVN